MKVQGSVLMSTAYRSSSAPPAPAAATGPHSANSPELSDQGVGEPGKQQLSSRALSVPCTGSQAVAEQLHLTQNWRTQKHVLAVANAVTDVMYHLFPGTVDKLPPESSNVKGELPVLLLPGQEHDPLRHVFTAADSSSTRSSGGAAAVTLPSNLNAQTAVIVRDESSAAPVREFVGDGALVLTVEEAKGLEYPVRDRVDEFPHTLRWQVSEQHYRSLIVCCIVMACCVALSLNDLKNSWWQSMSLWTIPWSEASKLNQNHLCMSRAA
eukprot:GHUV01032072.1.p1 GENE.GHUV01032072.1~~GHUV01032072.1.p1  ORF type:complete len:277 (-),score=76.73 GHUV01032072.1:338-1138(-)